MNIRIVGKKIKSVTNVKKITKAMQLVSAVKMKKAQQAALEGKPYQELLEEAMQRVSRKMDKSLSSLVLSRPQAKKTLAVLITTNKGLCGAFNFNLFRFMTKSTEMKETEFVTIGKKGAVFVSQVGRPVLADFSSNSSLDNVTAAFTFALNKFLADGYKEVVLFYNSFVSSLRYEPVRETLLPFILPPVKEESLYSEEYLIEPSPELIMDSLIKNFIEEKIRFSIVQSEAGEHSARMIAMQNATDNAVNVIYNLTLLRNKLRQQKITYELLDMVTAKESVELN